MNNKINMLINQHRRHIEKIKTKIDRTNCSERKSMFYDQIHYHDCKIQELKQTYVT